MFDPATGLAAGEFRIAGGPPAGPAASSPPQAGRDRARRPIGAGETPALR